MKAKNKFECMDALLRRCSHSYQGKLSWEGTRKSNRLVAVPGWFWRWQLTAMKGLMLGKIEILNISKSIF